MFISSIYSIHIFIVNSYIFLLHLCRYYALYAKFTFFICILNAWDWNRLLLLFIWLVTALRSLWFHCYTGICIYWHLHYQPTNPSLHINLPYDLPAMNLSQSKTRLHLLCRSIQLILFFLHVDIGYLLWSFYSYWWRFCCLSGCLLFSKFLFLTPKTRWQLEMMRTFRNLLISVSHNNLANALILLYPLGLSSFYHHPCEAPQ